MKCLICGSLFEPKTDNDSWLKLVRQTRTKRKLKDRELLIAIYDWSQSAMNYHGQQSILPTELRDAIFNQIFHDL